MMTSSGVRAPPPTWPFFERTLSGVAYTIDPVYEAEVREYLGLFSLLLRGPSFADLKHRLSGKG
jgi:hypothetical protein